MIEVVIHSPAFEIELQFGECDLNTIVPELECDDLGLLTPTQKQDCIIPVHSNAEDVGVGLANKGEDLYNTLEVIRDGTFHPALLPGQVFSIDGEREGLIETREDNGVLHVERVNPKGFALTAVAQENVANQPIYDSVNKRIVFNPSNPHALIIPNSFDTYTTHTQFTLAARFLWGGGLLSYILRNSAGTSNAAFWVGVGVDGVRRAGIQIGGEENTFSPISSGTRWVNIVCRVDRLNGLADFYCVSDDGDYDINEFNLNMGSTTAFVRNVIGRDSFGSTNVDLEMGLFTGYQTYVNDAQRAMLIDYLNSKRP